MEAKQAIEAARYIRAVYGKEAFSVGQTNDCFLSIIWETLLS